MQQIPKLRNLFILRNSSINLLAFIRTRSLSLNGRPNGTLMQEEDSNHLSYVAWDNDMNSNRNSEGTKKPGRRARLSSHGGKKRKKRSVHYSDYDVDPDSIFRETFGGKCFTWSFRSWDGSDFQCSSFGIEWRENESNWARNNKRVVWNTSSEEETDSEDDIDEELSTVGSCSNRMILGFPPRGSLKIDDVKSVFRSCALKWHPDKHRGHSQAMAAEKFKQCSEAYQFLCKELTSVQPA